MKMTEAEYIKEGGNICPHCESNDLEAGHVEADGVQAWCDVKCLSCGESWRDVYSMTRVVGFPAPEKVRLVLTIDVTYELNGQTQSNMEYQLKHSAQFLAGEGLLSGDGEAVVDTWKATVEEVPLES